MIAVRMAAEQNLNVLKAESQLFDRGANHRDCGLEVAVDQDQPSRRTDEKRAQRLRSDKVEVRDDLVRRERVVHMVARAQVARDKIRRRHWHFALLRTKSTGGANGEQRSENP